MLERHAEVGIAFVGRGVIGNAVGVDRIGSVESCAQAPRGHAQRGVGIDLETKIGEKNVAMILAVGNIVLRAIAGEAAEVVEALPVAAHASVFVIGAEGSTIGAEGEQWQRRVAARRGDADHAGQRVRSVQRAVGAALEFHALKAIGLQVGEVDVAANIVDGNAIEQDFVGVAGTAADVKRRQSSHLSRLHHLAAGFVAQRLAQVHSRGQRGAVDDADRRSHLRLGCRDAGGRHHDVLGHDGRR